MHRSRGSIARMAQPTFAQTLSDVASPEPVTEDPAWPAWPASPAWKDIVQLLRRAAQLAAEHGAHTDLFMQAAWVACLDARPGLREELEDKELFRQIEMLRQRGLVAAA